jgi:hypothetical protein
MTEEERQTVVTRESGDTMGEATTGPGVAESRSTVSSSRTVEMRPSGGELARRIVILLFGLIQVVIGLRILLLLINAREANDLVSLILDVSQIFVGPFEGILRTDALNASGSTLDLAAIVAFVGWTVLELIVLWVVNIFRREPA